MGGLATPFTNHQQHTDTMPTANHSVSKYRNQAQKLEEKQSCGAHQTDNGRVGWDHQIHTSRLPRMIRNHIYTHLYQVPYLPDNQSPSNRWHFTRETTLLHSCSAMKNLYFSFVCEKTDQEETSTTRPDDKMGSQVA